MYEPVAVLAQPHGLSAQQLATNRLSHLFLQQPFTSVESLLRPEPGGNELATASVRSVSLRSAWDQSAVSPGSVSCQSGVRLRSIRAILRSQTSARPCRIAQRVKSRTLRETFECARGGLKAQRSCNTSAVRHTWFLYSELGNELSFYDRRRYKLLASGRSQNTATRNTAED